eukprot:gnl/TRDRNA2_/TRDRNA2_177291_c0_seq1.p2 gnl/TRDRNA2_/TRDRNA2_177291_c0~~gnl/TRDRNA2_/TRDRNA2_177291_c0_seq1.p2  ORF type:complete len:159 (+),score=5.21 gnl/TRDRNA2_/TRDRNA2_177291_c0_seq1:1080-1556(+)
MTKTYYEIETEHHEGIEKKEKPKENFEDDDTHRLFNPLNLPLGADGKPIPFWLYKLHGLNLKFPCEICKDYVYEGRRSYEKHFRESRHEQGMRAIGIPNTAVFFEISSIGDAISLWSSVREKKAQKEGRSSKVEEFEDKEGNAYDKDTFNLLIKQGIL